MGSDNNTASQDFNFGKEAFGTLNNTISGIFAYQTAKETAKTLAKAPPANTAIIVGGIVGVFLIVFVLRKL